MENFHSWLLARQTMYALLAMFYRGELEEGLNILWSTDVFREIAEFSQDAILSSQIESLLNEVHDQKQAEHYQESLHNDFQRLFVGPGHLLAPPWESVYRTKEKLLFGEPDRVVRRIYRAAGLAVRSAEPADHIALELAFMARLCAIAQEQQERIGTLACGQRDFLEEHLLQWISPWADDVISNSQTDFWCNITRVTELWLAGDLLDLHAWR